MKKLLILILIFVIHSTALFSARDILKNILPSDEIVYVLRLNNGDIISGYVTEMMNHPEYGEGIKISTELGIATIYAKQIVEINPEKEHYRHGHRVFLLPTADPIGDGHFIGMFEVLFLYGGIGIADIVSITGGRTMIPQIAPDQQISDVNIKATFLHVPFESMEGYMSFAVGMNFAYVNAANRIINPYIVATFVGERSRITGNIFFKTGSEDFYNVRFYDQLFNMQYANGAVGIGLGLDTKFSKRNDLHFIGELWNNDITKPTNTGVLLGLRLANTNFSSDFGMAFFTEPFFAPFVSFVWTPF